MNGTSWVRRACREGRQKLGLWLRPFRGHLGLVAPCIGLLVIVVAAVGAQWVAPHDPNAQDLVHRLQPPVWAVGGNWTYPFGTDDLGRDLLSRIIYGARVSLAIGVLSVALRMTSGVVLGLAAGYFGGALESLIMRLGDVQLALPALVLALAIIAAIGPGFTNLILVLGISGWIIYARLVASQVVSIRSFDYVASARLLGASDLRILVRHVLPNVLPIILVYASLDVGMMMYAEASLSFIGVGIQPPTPSWGGMTAEGQAYLATQWWIATLPGLALLVTLVLINLLGEQARDYLDPRLRPIQ